MKIAEIKISEFTDEQLEFIYELHKTMEMKFALTNSLLGLDAGKSTAKEIFSILRQRKSVLPKPPIQPNQEGNEAVK